MRQAIERSASFVDKSNLEARIKEALEKPIIYDFAIDKIGRKVTIFILLVRRCVNGGITKRFLLLDGLIFSHNISSFFALHHGIPSFILFSRAIKRVQFVKFWFSIFIYHEN